MICGQRWFHIGSSLILIFSVTVACHCLALCFLLSCYELLYKVVEKNADLFFGLIYLLHYFVLQFRSQHTCTCTNLMSCVFTLQLPWCVGGVLKESAQDRLPQPRAKVGDLQSFGDYLNNLLVGNGMILFL